MIDSINSKTRAITANECKTLKQRMHILAKARLVVGIRSSSICTKICLHLLVYRSPHVVANKPGMISVLVSIYGFGLHCGNVRSRRSARLGVGDGDEFCTSVPWFSRHIFLSFSHSSKNRSYLNCSQSLIPSIFEKAAKRRTIFPCSYA